MKPASASASPARRVSRSVETESARSSGVATVAFNYGAAREHLQNGHSGVAVDSDENFINAALRLSGDDDLRTMLGSNASRAMQRLHPDHVVAEFEALLHELSARRRAHALAAT